MKHAASRELYAYWQEKRGTRVAPERTEIEPGAIRSVLADAFILTLDRKTGYPIRLAGTRLCALFGREIKEESFLDLWAATNRPTLEGLLSILSDECIGTVAGAAAQSASGETVELELLLLPLSIRRPIFARAIGVLAPLKIPPWLGCKPPWAGDDRRTAPCRPSDREAALAALCDAAQPARLSGLRGRRTLDSGA